MLFSVIKFEIKLFVLMFKILHMIYLRIVEYKVASYICNSTSVTCETMGIVKNIVVTMFSYIM